MSDQEQIGSHWDGCYHSHHECAIAKIDQLRRQLSGALVKLAEAKAQANDYSEVATSRGCTIAEQIEVISGLVKDVSKLTARLAEAKARCDDIEKGRNFLLSEVIRLKEVIRVKNERSFGE